MLLTSSAKVADSVKGWLLSPLVSEAWVLVRVDNSVRAAERAAGFVCSRMA